MDDAALRNGLILTNELLINVLAMDREPFPSGRRNIAAGIEKRARRLIAELARVDAAPEQMEEPSNG